MKNLINNPNLKLYRKGVFHIPRKRRLWFPGATYHVICRGNHQQEIFRSREDYKVFLKIVEETKEIHPFDLHSYCLMTNHFHLAVETKNVEVWHIMNRISKKYCNYYNKKYGLVGHLFQGRYNAPIIDDLAYLLQTSRYIHRNPVKANIVSKPQDYEWSSYRAYLGLENNKLVTTQKILKEFVYSKITNYQEYVEGALCLDNTST